MHDGTTPLILAARLAVEGMLEDLINSHADVNAVDDLGKPGCGPGCGGWARCPCQPTLTDPWLPLAGKSALHWAAAVNNVEAAVVLLKNGANKDMQNNKVGLRAGARLQVLSQHLLFENRQEGLTQMEPKPGGCGGLALGGCPGHVPVCGAVTILLSVSPKPRKLSFPTPNLGPGCLAQGAPWWLTPVCVDPTWVSLVWSVHNVTPHPARETEPQRCGDCQEGIGPWPVPRVSWEGTTRPPAPHCHPHSSLTGMRGVSSVQTGKS